MRLWFRSRSPFTRTVTARSAGVGSPGGFPKSPPREAASPRTPIRFRMRAESPRCRSGPEPGPATTSRSTSASIPAACRSRRSRHRCTRSWSDRRASAGSTCPLPVVTRFRIATSSCAGDCRTTRSPRASSPTWRRMHRSLPRDRTSRASRVGTSPWCSHHRPASPTRTFVPASSSSCSTHRDRCGVSRSRNRRPWSRRRSKACGRTTPSI